MKDIFDSHSCLTIKNLNVKLEENFKTSWVKALRSGKYKQGNFYLHNVNKNSFCCLGVACEINRVNLITCVQNLFNDNKIEYYLLPSQSIEDAVINNIGAGLMKEELAKHFNLDQVQLYLSSLNDEGYTFYEIADVIEKYL